MKKELLKNEYVSEIEKILKSDDTKEEIQDKLEDFHENDIADALELLDKEERLKLYDILDVDVIAKIFTYLEDAKEYIEEMNINKTADIIEEMDADDAIDILEDLDEDIKNNILKLVEGEVKEDIDLISSYEDDEIGSVMTTNYIAIQDSLTIKQAMKELVSQASENDNISTIYVEKDNCFYGVIDLKDLICARENESLEDIIVTGYPYVTAEEKIDDCINYISDYNEDSIPVLDNKNRIIGVITSQDLVELIDDEMGEDYSKLAGLTGEEDLNETLFESIKKRIPWLIVLLVLGLGVSYVVGLFEIVVASLPIVIAFQSLILDMAGNVGTQSLAVTIRVLTDENLSAKDFIRLILKEMRVGMTNGFILGLLSFIFIGLYIWLFKTRPVHQAYAISACIGFSLMVAMIVSSFTGTIIPIGFKKLGIDPAVASGPLITTVNDLVAVVTYYGLTWILLIGVLNIVG